MWSKIAKFLNSVLFSERVSPTLYTFVLDCRIDNKKESKDYVNLSLALSNPLTNYEGLFSVLRERALNYFKYQKYEDSGTDWQSEFGTLSAMLQHAERAGLLVEVVHAMARESQSGVPVNIACARALYEWDI